MSTSPAPPPARPSVAPRLGFWMAMALVTGNMIGSGVFLLPASLASFGGLGLAGWLVSAGGATCLALVFARLARVYPASGGVYAYTRRAFGDLPAFLVAWGYWISCWSTTAALSIAAVAYLDPFMPGVVRTPALAALVAVGFVWLFALVNVAGVRRAGRVQVLATLIKILPLAVVGVAGVVMFQPEGFAVDATGPREVAGGVTAAATLTLWAFLGLESATIPAGSIANPERTIPRATIAGTLGAAGIYVVSTIGVMSLVPQEQLAVTTAPFADAVRLLLGGSAAGLVAIGAAVSCLGSLNGWTLVAGQLPAAAARDCLFPAVFARQSRSDTPAAGIVIAAILSSALIAMNYTRSLVELFTFIVLLATLATLVPYVCCTLAAFRIEAGSLTGRMAAVAGLAFVYALWAIGGAGADVVYWGGLLFVAGLPVFIWIRRPLRE